MNSPPDSFGDSRKIIRTASTQFDEYDIEGPMQEDITWLRLSYDRKTGQGAYMMRMQPGAETIRHVHKRREEYLILEGDFIESDGTVLGPGDYVIYMPETGHNSRTVNGCLLIGIDYSFSDLGTR
ncbi:MAG: cupin domain-containing protein [Arenicellales bacterium]